VMVTELRRTSG